jgi:GNAT superfamily N-acetyltransferase
MAHAITLRAVTRADERFLCELYSSTRHAELARLPWDEVQKAAFLQTQFDAQHRYYRDHYPNGAFDLILIEGLPAGRLYVNRGTDELRVVDISLLPQHRNHRTGAHLIGALQTEAALARKPLRAHVERFNPAIRLFERLGFQPVADRGVYLLVEWRSSD